VPELRGVVSLEAFLDLLLQRLRVGHLPDAVLRLRVLPTLGELRLAVGVLRAIGVDGDVDVVDRLARALVEHRDARPADAHVFGVPVQRLVDALLERDRVLPVVGADEEVQPLVDVVVAV
jgi:hypothetical protein